jgi:hypothetical protein
MFGRGEVALVVDGGDIVGILTKLDLIEYLSKTVEVGQR